MFPVCVANLQEGGKARVNKMCSTIKPTVQTGKLVALDQMDGQLHNL